MLGQKISIDNETSELRMPYHAQFMNIRGHLIFSYHFVQNIDGFHRPDAVMLTVSFFCYENATLHNRSLAEGLSKYQRSMQCPQFWSLIASKNVCLSIHSARIPEVSLVYLYLTYSGFIFRTRSMLGLRNVFESGTCQILSKTASLCQRR